MARHLKTLHLCEFHPLFVYQRAFVDILEQAINGIESKVIWTRAWAAVTVFRFSTCDTYTGSTERLTFVKFLLQAQVIEFYYGWQFSLIYLL